jgi:hypothetical protein
VKEPTTVLEGYTRIRTHETLGSTAGFMVTDRHLSQRRPNAVGAISGFVPGHGGDVYYVTHEGSSAMAVYCFDEFELEPVVEPKCPHCKGSGIDFPTSATLNRGICCQGCLGSGSSTTPPRATAWEKIKAERIKDEP